MTFQETRKREQCATQRLEEQELRLTQERERRIAQQREVCSTGSRPEVVTSGLIPNQGSFSFQVRKKEKETAEKIAARAYAQDYLMGK